MKKKIVVGLLLQQGIGDARALFAEHVDLIITPPAYPRSEMDVSRSTGVRTFCLARLLKRGGRTSRSKYVGAYLRDIATKDPHLTIEKLSSINDIHEYTVINLYLFEAAFSEFISRVQPALVCCDSAPYHTFIAPFRQNISLIFSEARQQAFAAHRICHVASIGFTSRRPMLGVLARRFDSFGIRFRDFVLRLIILANVLAKIAINNSVRSAEAFSSEVSIAFIVRTPSEVYSALPIIERLASRNIPTIILADELISASGTKQLLRSLGLKFLVVGRLAGLVNTIRALGRPLGFVSTLGAGLPSYFCKVVAGSSHNSIFDVANQEVTNELWRMADGFKVAQRHLASELDAVVRAYNVIHIVGFGYLDQFGFIPRLVADRYRISATTIQNAAIDPDDYPYLVRTHNYCVESRWLKELYVEYGASPETLYATGVPFRGAPVIVDHDPAWRLKRILIVCQPIYVTYFEMILKATADFVNKNGLSLAIKIHPRQRADAYDTIIQSFGAAEIISRFHHEELISVIEGADLVIGITSAALVRASEKGKPVIVFAPPELMHLDLDFTSDQFVFSASTMQELVRLLYFALADPISFYDEFRSRHETWCLSFKGLEPGEDVVDNILAVMLGKSSMMGLSSEGSTRVELVSSNPNPECRN